MARIPMPKTMYTTRCQGRVSLHVSMRTLSLWKNQSQSHTAATIDSSPPIAKSDAII